MRLVEYSITLRGEDDWSDNKADGAINAIDPDLIYYLEEAAKIFLARREATLDVEVEVNVLKENQ
jgi:hypothetical protein